MQDLVIILVFVILMPMTLIGGGILLAKRIAKSRPPVLTPFERQRELYANRVTNDLGPLLEEIKKMEEKEWVS
jgi:hypothetical protein